MQTYTPQSNLHSPQEAIRFGASNGGVCEFPPSLSPTSSKLLTGSVLLPTWCRFIKRKLFLWGSEKVKDSTFNFIFHSTWFLRSWEDFCITQLQRNHCHLSPHRSFWFATIYNALCLMDDYHPHTTPWVLEVRWYQNKPGGKGGIGHSNLFEIKFKVETKQILSKTSILTPSGQNSSSPHRKPVCICALGRIPVFLNLVFMVIDGHGYVSNSLPPIVP